MLCKELGRQSETSWSANCEVWLTNEINVRVLFNLVSVNFKGACVCARTCVRVSGLFILSFFEYVFLLPQCAEECVCVYARASECVCVKECGRLAFASFSFSLGLFVLYLIGPIQFGCVQGSS